MNVSIMETSGDDKTVLYRTKFFILLGLQIPSIILILFIFIFFYIHRTLLNVLQNQSLLLLLIVNFLSVSADLPMLISFYHFGRVNPATPAYCTWWTFFEYSLNLISELLMATISIQRHILIFNAHILLNRFKCFLFYYIPLLLCFIYPIIVYIFIILLYTCDGSQWNYTAKVCGYANCYLVYSKALSTFDMALNNGLPIFVILLANVVLIIRFVQQKRRRQRLISWQKQRRMTLQLLSISSLYLIGWLPSLLIGLVQQLKSPEFLAEFLFNYALDFVYLVCLLLPWVCLGLLPKFRKWIRQLFYCGQIAHNIIRPVQ